VKYTYTYEVAMLIHIEAETNDEAQNLITETADEIANSYGSPGYEFALCNTVNQNGENIFCSSEEFVPFPISE
jgi:hypothetical protein